MEAVSVTSGDPAAVERPAALGRDIETGLGGRGDRAALDGRVGALGDDDTGLRRVDGAVVQRATAAVVTEPGAGRRLPDPAVVELCGRPVAHRHRRVADLGEIAVDDIGARTPVEDEDRVRHVVDPAGVQYHGRPVAHPDRRVVTRTVVDLALVGVDPGARVPYGEAVAAEAAHRGPGQREDRPGTQIHRVLRDVMDVAVGERQHRIRVERDPVRRSAVHRAVGEMGGGAGCHLYPAALDLVHLAADPFQSAALTGDTQPRARGVVDAATLQPRMRTVAHRDPGLPGRDDLALLEHPARTVEYGDTDPGGVVDRAAAHGGAGRTAHLDPGGGPRHDPQIRQFRSAVLDEERGGRRVLALHVQILDDGGGAERQRYAVDRRDPYGADRALGAAQRHRAVQNQILPVGARRDGEDITVRRGLQGRGEEAYSPVRRRHRDVPVCVTWTVPCAMALLCPHLVRVRCPDHRSLGSGHSGSARRRGGRAGPP